MKTNFYLWCGKGYILDLFTIESEKEDMKEQFELLAKKLIDENQKDYFLTEEQFDTICKDLSEDEKEDMEEEYMYINSTYIGAAYPIYLRMENLRVK